MIKRLRLLALLGLLLIGWQSQAQLTVTVGTGTTNNTGTTYPSPYGNWYESSRAQFLVLASELTAAGASAGNINALDFDVVTTALSNYQTGTPGGTLSTALLNFEIKLGSTTVTDLSGGFVAGLTSVYTNPSYTDQQGWNNHPFTTNFFWDGVSNVVIEVCFDNSTPSGTTSYTNNATVNMTGAGFMASIWDRQDNVNTCPGTSGTVFNSQDRPNMRFGFLPTAGTDAAATALISPTSPVTPGNATVTFRINNFAANTITSGTAGFSVNGGTPVIEPFSGSIPLGGNTLHTFATQATIPATGIPQLKVWITNANGSPDLNPANDTLTVNLCLALPAGTYTVGTGGTYSTIQDAVNAITCGGVAGPVVFQILPGTYYGRYTISAVPGSSATNSVMFTSSTGSASDVVLLCDTAIAAPHRDVFRIQNANNISFSNLTFARPVIANVFASSILLNYGTGASNGSVSGCVFNDSTTVFGNTGVRFSGGGFNIDGNTFNRISDAIVGIGSATSPSLNAIIANNNINNYRGTGISLTRQGEPQINNNTLTGNSTNVPGTGIRLESVNGSDVRNNLIKGSIGTNAFYLIDMNNVNATSNKVYNNVINLVSNSANPRAFSIEGRYDTLSVNGNPKDNLEIVFNTARLEASSGTAFGTNGMVSLQRNFASFDAYTFDSFVFKNNNIAGFKAGNVQITGNSWGGLFVADTALLSGAQFSNNNYFQANSVSPLFIATFSPLTYNTVADWTTATGQEAGSVSANPIFATATNLTPSALPLNNAGTPIASVTTDFTGAARSTTPDIGAYEFNIGPNDVGVVAITSPNNGCGLTANENVVVRIYNFGTAVANNINVSYSINGGTPVSAVFAGPINPGDTVSYTFTTPANLSVAGNYNFLAIANVSGDLNALNDSSTKVVVSIPVISTFPYTQNFDAGNGGWVSGGTNSSWALGTPAKSVINSAASAPNSWVTNLTGEYNSSEASYVQSPCFSFSSLSNPKLRMKIWWETENNWDGANVQYSTDGGATWTVLGTVGSGINWYTAPSVNSSNGQPVWVGNPGSGTWLNAEYPLAILANQAQVQFRINFTSDLSAQDDGFAFDDFTIIQPVDPVIQSVTRLNDTCSVMTRQVTARIIRFAGLQTVNLHYDLTNSGTFTAVPMTFNSATNLWTGIIPGGTAGMMIRYLVTALDSAGLSDTSDVFSYTNAYLLINAGANQNITTGQSATLTASLPNENLVRISEITLFKTGTGQTSPYPAYVNPNDADFIEVTNFGAAPISLSGYTVEVVGATTRSFTVPSGVILPSSATMVLNVGAGTDDPANFYYNMGGTNGSLSSGSQAGFILKNTTGKVIDAVASNGYSFGSASGVVAADWSGAIPSSSGNAGLVRTNVDANNASDWAISSVTAQSIGAINPGITVSSSAQVTWNTVPPTQNITVTVGPFAAAGTYNYIATVTDGVCSSSDTVSVIVTGGSGTLDGGFTRVSAPAGSTVTLNQPVTIRGWFRNTGTIAISNTTVGYRINNNPAVTQPFAGPLNAGDSVQVTFTTPWTPTVGGSYTIKTFSAIAGDVNVQNDTARKVVSTQMIDGGVSRIISPTSNSNISSATPISAIVKNFGNMPITGFDVAYSVNNVFTATQSVTTTIQPGDSITFQFTAPWTPTGSGARTIRVYTTGLTNDVNRTNDTASVSVNSTVSVSELNGKDFGKVYPNPASSELNVQFVSSTNGGRLQLIDALGRIVKERVLNGDLSEITETLNVSDVKAGIYTLRYVGRESQSTASIVIRK